MLLLLLLLFMTSNVCIHFPLISKLRINPSLHNSLPGWSSSSRPPRPRRRAGRGMKRPW